MSFIPIALVAVLLYAAARVVYRLYFHPLAKFPGPKLAAVSYLYEFYQDVWAKEGGDYIYQVDEMHDKYGPIVRVTPDEVHVKDTEWSHVLYTEGKNQIRDKDSSLAHAAGTNDGTFGSVKHEIHRRRRIPVNAYFSKTAVYEMQDKIWERAARLGRVLRSHFDAATVVPGRAVFLGWSNDTLRYCAFGRPLDLVDNYDRAMQFNGVFQAFALVYPLLKQVEWLIPAALTLPTAPFWYIWQPLAIVLQTHKETISMAKHAEAEHNEKFPNGTRPKVQDNSRTLYHALLSSDLPQSEKRPHRMANEGFEILLAGSDTTARTMGVAVYHINANPYVKERLKAELAPMLPSGPDGRIDLRQLEKLPFLTACMKEALRIGKVTDHRLSLVAREEDLQYKDWVIPAGSRISMTPTRNSYDEKFFPNPTVFAPERWLQDAETVATMEKYFMPFAAGRRGCLGLYFAQAELRIGLARIFHDFDFELHDTIRERDIDHTWSHIAGEPPRAGKGLRFRVVGAA